jgi:plastocyanin
MKRLATFALVTLTLLTAACGGSNRVGDEGLTKFDEKKNNQLGASTTTQPVAPTSQGTVATTRPVVTTAAPQQASFQISIQSDNTGSAFNPPEVVGVPKGSKVVWTNRDSVVRSVVGDDPSFGLNSGPISPGASWSYTATKPGRVNYKDGTRNYAVAAFEVVA